MTKFQVTQEDIDNGIRSRPFLCPVALCMQRTLKKNVRVGFGVIEVFDPIYRVFNKEYYTPDKVVGFAYAFDYGQKVEPFEFELDVD